MDSRPADTRHCNTCGQDLPSTEFYRKGDGSDRLQTRCKQCSADYQRAYNLARRPPPRPPLPIPSEKPCPRCGQTKPLDQFAPRKDSRDGRSAHCRDCRRVAKAEYNATHKAERAEYNQRYYRENAEAVGARIRASVAKNPDKYRAIHSNWKRKNVGACRAMAHRRYARQKSAGSWTQGDWERLKAQFEWRCLMCGRQEMTDGITLCFDHVIPLSLGGWNIISNAQPLCKSCNSKKHRKVLDLRRHKE